MKSLKKGSLPELLSCLNSLDAKAFKGDQVDRYLAEHKLNEQQFLPFIYFREDTYGRNLVFKTDCYEMLVLTWLPQQRTPIHDHAGQRCWMHVTSGELSFKSYKPIKRPSDKLVPLGEPETRKAGETIYIDDGIGVHCIVNTSNKPAVSMHLYAGPIPRCQVYREDKKCFEWVQLEYFTRFCGEWEKQSPAAH
jgi:cysteine dioxygenase